MFNNQLMSPSHWPTGADPKPFLELVIDKYKSLIHPTYISILLHNRTTVLYIYIVLCVGGSKGQSDVERAKAI